MNRNMKAITWALEVRGLEPGPFRVLMVLCSFVGKLGYDVWPSYATIAEKAEISRPSAKRFVAVLIERGFIIQAGERWRDNGGRSVNVYRIKVGEIGTADVGPDEEDEYVSERDPRFNLTRGQTHSSDPGARFTAEPCREPLKEGTSIPEDSPLSLTGETPPRDLLGDLDTSSTALEPAKPSILEYVAVGWRSLTERYTRIPSVRAWSDARKRAIVRRADEVVRASAGTLDAYQVWDQIFNAIAGDLWLRGESDPGKGYDRAYVVEIDHVLRTGGTPNFLWILERAATNDRDNRLSNDPATGRRMGPAEQATHAALARLRAARERGGRGGDQPRDNGARS